MFQRREVLLYGRRALGWLGAGSQLARRARGTCTRDVHSLGFSSPRPTPDPGSSTQGRGSLAGSHCPPLPLGPFMKTNWFARYFNRFIAIYLGVILRRFIEGNKGNHYHNGEEG